MATKLTKVTEDKLRERGWQALKPVYANKLLALGCPEGKLESALDEIKQVCWDKFSAVGRMVAKGCDQEKARNFASEYGFFAALDEQLLLQESQEARSRKECEVRK